MTDSKAPEPLHASPTAGVASEHSAYYRRLLSAGYKGHVQGSIGGATLYGTFGLIIGAIVGLPLLFFSGGSLLPLLLIPALGGLGALEGAKTFADIGSHAAIMADSAELNEKRRTLLDQRNATRDPGKKEAINQQLAAQLESQPMRKLLHWKMAAVGALLGGALALGAMMLAPMMIPEVLASMALSMHIATGAAGVVGAFALPAIIAGTLIGALSGAVIGIDREYVRRWLDSSETLVSDSAPSVSEMRARANDRQPEAAITHADAINPDSIMPPRADTASMPSVSVSSAAHHGLAQTAPQLAQSQA